MCLIQTQACNLHPLFSFPQEPFPVGTNIRTRPGRARILSWEENGTPPKSGGDTPGYMASDNEPTVVA
jgi:hypothetical protein